MDTFRQRFETIAPMLHVRDVMPPGWSHACISWSISTTTASKPFRKPRIFCLLLRCWAVSRERAELWLAYGPPEAVIGKIQAYIEAGCTMPVLRFVSPDLKTQLQRCIEEVLPAFRAA